ncbi:MAG: bifunctional diguanylate cyclase/phosphodiesterase [Halioglobus sp.]
MNPLPEIERQAFLSSLGGAIAKVDPAKSNLGLLLIDLTNLGLINLDQGYDLGDQVLLAAWDALLDVSKLPDTVFRLGGHTFAFILPGLDNPAFISLALNKVQRLLEDTVQPLLHDLELEVRVGLCVNLGGRRTVEETLATAEASLKHIKRGGQYRLEDLVGDEPQIVHDAGLERKLREAFEENAFELYFQPKISLDSGQVVGAEALLRWFPSGYDAIDPERVLQMAEEIGRGYDLTKWVVHSTLRQIKNWQSTMNLPLALNVQPAMVGNPELTSMVRDALAIWGVDPRRLTIEITESGVIEDKSSGYSHMMKLREQGIGLAIDDFGTGYSSLSYFKHIPATELKIDKAFVLSMIEEPLDLELVKAIVHLTHRFGLKVVAEGVETQEALEVLKEIKCDTAQGFLFSPPLPQDAFEQWVTDWKGW